MTTGELTPVLRYLCRVGDDDAGLSDGQLLERFARRRDADSFAALLRRHGPMVLGVCRRVLRDAHEAEDAFQATFLLLVRKAHALRQPDRLGPWLHGVAYRTAVRARARAARRPAWDGRVEDLPDPARDDLLWRDLRPVLDAAIGGLPSKYRVPFVLCYLEGLTNAQAAQQLGCPPGTVATRLARARARLRARLTRQGVAVGALLGLAVATRTAAAVPPALLAATAGAAAAGVFPETVTTLMKGVGKAMLMDRVRVLVVALAALAVAGGAGMWTYRALAGEPPARPEDEQRAVPLPEAGPAPAVPLPPSGPPPGMPPLGVKEAGPPATYRTTNFDVTAPNRRAARLVAEAAEQQRRALAVSWLGEELPDWPKRCSVRVSLSVFPDADGPPPGGHATTFQYADGKVLDQQMHLMGTLEQVLARELPHEVTHTVLAHRFGGPVPRWADEGAALLAEDEEERYEELVQKLLATPGRLIPLGRLLPMRDYPKDLGALYGEGYSLTRFLAGRKDRPTFVAFVARGMRGDWDAAARRFYGFRDVDELEQAWRKSLPRPGRAAQAEPGVPPLGPAPVTASARVGRDGRVRLRVPVTVYTPVQTTTYTTEGKKESAGYEQGVAIQDRYYNAGEVRAFDLDGKPVGPEALAELLARERAVLVSTDGKMVAPYYLQLIKKGTLVLVPPAGPPEAPQLVQPPPAPAGN